MLKPISVVGYVVMVGGFLALLAQRAVFSASPFVMAVQAIALLLLAWARWTFGRRSFHFAANPTQGGLITNGPYRYIRHPIYAAVSLFTWAGIAGHWSWAAFSCGLVVLVGALARIFSEEILVAARYPEYADYARHTWRMVPYIF